MNYDKKIIILIGPIGSGKDTQADILADKLHLFRLRTSQLLEDKFNHVKPDNPDYNKLQKEKTLWAGGTLNTPEWVLSVVQEKVKEVASGGQGIIFSGSPRTLFEAEGLMPFLEKLYGKESIKIFLISLSAEESIKRNSKRLICKQNLHPIAPDLVEKGITKCPIDSSELVTRVLDKPETIKVRYQEYLNRTAPIIDYFKDQGLKMADINGEQSIEKVSQDIFENL
ncbi:MAG: nucleoside monophosphate kinase [Patescibacteria group bacterium]